MEVAVPGEARAVPGETAHSDAEAAPALELEGDVWDVPLDWQPQLDAASETIDSGLPVKRRWATGAVVSIRFRWPLFSFTRGGPRSRARG